MGVEAVFERHFAAHLRYTWVSIEYGSTFLITR
jgi:hypothetical protein